MANIGAVGVEGSGSVTGCRSISAKQLHNSVGIAKVSADQVLGISLFVITKYHHRVLPRSLPSFSDFKYIYTLTDIFKLIQEKKTNGRKAHETEAYSRIILGSD
jgi:hypothetical protein